MDVSIYCHLDRIDQAEISCNQAPGVSAPSLVFGPLVVFVTEDQLKAVRAAIDGYLDGRLPVQCDVCGKEFQPLEEGHVSAKAAVCGGCVSRHGLMKLLGDDAPPF